MEPVNLYKNEKTWEIIKRYVNILTKFNIIIDGLLEKRTRDPYTPPFYMLIETELDRKYIENINVN